MSALSLLGGPWARGLAAVLALTVLLGTGACAGNAPDAEPPQDAVIVPEPEVAAEIAFPGSGPAGVDADLHLDPDEFAVQPPEPSWPLKDPDWERLVAAPLIVTEEHAFLQYGAPAFGLIPTDARANSGPIPRYVVRPGDFRLLEPWVPVEIRYYSTRTTERTWHQSRTGRESAVEDSQSSADVTKWLEQLAEQLQRRTRDWEGQAGSVVGPPAPEVEEP
jgi:hypothetical protein